MEGEGSGKRVKEEEADSAAVGGMDMGEIGGNAASGFREI